MVTNSEFLAAIYGTLPAGEYGWICAFAGDPNRVSPDAWSGQPFVGNALQAELIDKRTTQNTYYSVARFALRDVPPRRKKSNFEQLVALVADDADRSALNGAPSFVIETSLGKHQVGILLELDDPATRDAALIDSVMQAMADARLIHADSSGNNAVRYCRLPGGVNGKGGTNHPVQILEWRPEHRLTLEDALAVFGLDLDAVQPAAPAAAEPAPAGTPHQELLQAVLSGKSYHDPLTRLAAKLVSGGLSGGATVAHLRGLMESLPDRSERWQSRYAEIPRMVASAEQFRPEPLGKVTINLGGSQTAPEAPAELAPMDWGSLAERPPEPATFRLPGWMPARTTTLLSANGGVGKSNLSLQLAAALALGAPFLGLDVEPCKVLVLSAEDEARTVHFRLSNILNDLGVPLAQLQDQLVAYDLTQADSVMWRDGAPTARMQWLAETVERHQPGVVVIDNASDVFCANENDRAEVRGFMRCLNAIALQSGAAILLLAHVDKASVRMKAGEESNSTFSGSTAWNNSARSRWAMTREGDVVTLRHEKCNLGPLQDQLRLEFDAAAKVFRKFGQIQSTAFARSVLRDQQRVQILRTIRRAQQKHVFISASEATRGGSADAHTACEKVIEPRKAFFAELTRMQLDGLVTVRVEVRGNRKPAQQLVLTPAGERMIGEG